ncbi:hypothetical protein Hte_006728 [Hypoxylon texense]
MAGENLVEKRSGVRLRQYSVGEADRPTTSHTKNDLRCDLAAQGEQIAVDHAVVNRDAAGFQNPEEDLEYSPTVLIEQSGLGYGQAHSDHVETTHTSHQSPPPDPETVAQSTLRAPLYPLPPESPGFPTLLATMDFPSPPMHSGSSSPDRRIECAPLRIRPRTSSKRAPTSNSGTPTASLDELIMQSTCSAPPHLGSGGNSSASEGSAATGILMQNAVAGTTATSDIYPVPIEARCDSVTSTASDNASSMRQSLLSEIPTMASSPLTPPTTNESYNLVIQSPLTGKQASCSAAGDILSVPEAPISRHHTHPMSDSILVLAQPSPAESLTLMKSTLHGCNPKSESGNSIDRPTSTSTGRDVDVRRRIVDRRIARKTRVQAYKRRDLNATRLFVNTANPTLIDLESKDSPILGWFTNVSSSRELPIRSNDLVLSRVMSTEIKPDDYSPHHSGPLGTGNEVRVSPIMVMSDIRPQEESSKLIESTVYSPTSRQPSRPALKHKIKITPQPRPKSMQVMIHRNPATGDIERSMSATNKSIRHSLTSVPLSPNSLSFKRDSRPAGEAENNLYDEITPTPTSGNATSEVVAAVPRGTDLEIYTNLRIELRKERLQKEKLSRDREISKLVAETLSTPNRNKKPKQSQEDHAAQEIDRRLQRLEENGGAWLEVVKSLLNNMSKTLEEIRENNHQEKLIKREFTAR